MKWLKIGTIIAFFYGVLVYASVICYSVYALYKVSEYTSSSVDYIAALIALYTGGCFYFAPILLPHFIYVREFLFYLLYSQYDFSFAEFWSDETRENHKKCLYKAMYIAILATIIVPLITWVIFPAWVAGVALGLWLLQLFIICSGIYKFVCEGDFDNNGIKMPQTFFAISRLLLVSVLAIGMALCWGGIGRGVSDLLKREWTADTIVTDTVTKEESLRKETSSKSSQTETKNLYDLSTPDGAFRYYHMAITKHDLQTAYQCFSDEFQTQMEYSGWAAGYDTTLLSDPEKIEIMANDGYTAILSFRLKAVDRAGNSTKTQYFVGECSLIKVNGVWRIDSISAQYA